MCLDNELNGLEDDDWAVDVSDAAVKERMRDLSAGVKHLTVSNHVDRSQSERLELFFDYCKVTNATFKIKFTHLYVQSRHYDLTHRNMLNVSLGHIFQNNGCEFILIAQTYRLPFILYICIVSSPFKIIYE